MTAFNIHPRADEEIHLFLTTGGEFQKKSSQCTGSISPHTGFAKRTVPILSAAIRDVLTAWPETDVDVELARHFDGFPSFLVGQAHVFLVEEIELGKTTVPAPIKMAELLKHDRVRVWQMTGEVSTYPRKEGVYDRGTAMKVTQLVVSYLPPNVCENYAFCTE